MPNENHHVARRWLSAATISSASGGRSLKGTNVDFADVINELTERMNGSSWAIKGLVGFPDLADFQRQETDMRTLPVEWVSQKGSEDFGGFYGTIYFPTTYPNGDGGVLHLHVEYHD